MKILSWNVNGLRACMKKDFMEFLENEDPDILGIQETKLQEDQIPKEILEQTKYKTYFSSAEKKGYSGVALFTKEEPIKVSYCLPDDRFNHEGRQVIAEFKDFVLINSYFPNGQMNDDRLQFKMDYYDCMFDYMQEIVKSGKNIIVCGDYNTAHKEIDLKNPKANSERSGFLPIERAWIDKIIENGYVDTFREFNSEPHEYSWWSYRFKAREKNAGWRIDYFFVNKDFIINVKNAFIQQDIMGSDHCPVGIELKG